MIKEIKISEKNQKMLKQINDQITDLQRQARLIIVTILNQEGVNLEDYQLEISEDYSKIIIRKEVKENGKDKGGEA